MGILAAGAAACAAMAWARTVRRACGGQTVAYGGGSGDGGGGVESVRRVPAQGRHRGRRCGARSRPLRARARAVRRPGRASPGARTRRGVARPAPCSIATGYWLTDAGHTAPPCIALPGPSSNPHTWRDVGEAAAAARNVARVAANERIRVGAGAGASDSMRNNVRAFMRWLRLLSLPRVTRAGHRARGARFRDREPAQFVAETV